MIGLIDAVIVGVVTTVISSLVVEWIREIRQNEKQFLERAVDFSVTIIREVWSLIRERL